MMKMKKMHNIIVKFITAVVSFAAVSGCTGSFEEYNTNPYAPTIEEMNRDNTMVSSLMDGMITSLCQTQENDVQEIEIMIGSEYGGMTAARKQWREGADHDFSGFNPRDVDCDYTYNEIMAEIGAGYFQLREITGGEGDVFALATIIRVASMLRLSDIYGPMPYSQQDGNKTVVPYDSEKDLYNYMRTDLDGAIEALQSMAVSGKANAVLAAAGDPVFHGNYGKWVKFANTIKLRMAIRMLCTTDSEAQAAARTMVQEVLEDPVGPMLEVDDHAVTTAFDKSRNLYNYIANEWNEIRANANIVYYLASYGDPRLSIYTNSYYTPSFSFYPFPSGVLQGAPTGNGEEYENMTKLKIGENDPQWIMSPAETWFLLAEAGLKGCDISAKGTPQSCYEQGIRVSMQERGANIGSYMSETNTIKNQSFNDGINDPQNLQLRENAPIRWSDDPAKQLSQILTQKWLANFPNGFETWADVRRTGYPLFLTPVSRNSDVHEVKEMCRLKFPTVEYNTNRENVNAAVSMLNGGTDAYTTRLWWDND